MDSPSSTSMEELGRCTRDAPPTHFIFKIESFSTLSASSMKRYESPEFEAADAKWKLAIYPNGNKARDGQDHISMYLVLADKSNKDILVSFKLFVYDHIRDKYLTVVGESRFNPVKSEYGFHKFLPLEEFNDAANGYLINENTCLLGAEVYLIQNTYELKCLSMVAEKSDPFKYTWKIAQFSNMEDEVYYSEKFKVGGYDWKIMLYPKGNGRGNGNSLSLFLKMEESGTSVFKTEKQVVVEYKLRLVDQLNQNHTESRHTYCFKSSDYCMGWGFPCFLSLDKLKKESNGYLVNDLIIVETEVIVLGSTTDCV